MSTAAVGRERATPGLFERRQRDQDPCARECLAGTQRAAFPSRAAARCQDIRAPATQPAISQRRLVTEVRASGSGRRW
jgi:hypothetical protein